MARRPEPGPRPSQRIEADGTITRSVGRVDRVASCAVCGENHPFEMPEELITAALDRKLVVFAGAGISTEARRVYSGTFAEGIARELGHTTMTVEFPQLMSEYEKKFGRRQLLMRIKARFDYVKAFPDLLHMAAMFHRELSTAYFLDQIVTTNWDPYFEDYAGATPIVIPEDYAFWDLEGRKVFKLHGSMYNLGKLVATQADYERCYRELRDGVIGGSLRHLLATKRVVFIGYSFGDPDLNRILRFVRKQLADVLPRSYLVTPHGYEGKGFPPERVISTDGTYFIRRLKDAAIDRARMRPDSVYPRMAKLADTVQRAHDRVIRTYKASRTPAVVHTLAYQDGLLHAFDRILTMRSSGFYSDPHSTVHTVPRYAAIRVGAVREHEYFDAAYAEGYRNGLMSLDFDKATTDELPLYFVWGSGEDLLTFADFARELGRASSLHKAATAQAIRLTTGLTDDLVAQHTPFLDTDRYVAAAKKTGHRGPSGRTTTRARPSRPRRR